MSERNQNLWDNLKKGLQDSAAMAVRKAEELTLLSRARLDIAAAKTRLSRLHAELGVNTYRQVSGPEGSLTKTPGLQSLCDQIGRTADEVAEAEAAFKRAKAEQEDSSE